MTTPEGKVKEEIKRELTKLGAYFFMPVQMGYGARTVDILACVSGRFVAIEVKKPGAFKLTDNQRGVLAAIRRAGGDAFVAQSWADVKCMLPDESERRPPIYPAEWTE
jgi:protein involved in polysaccharide export with SLBB domain